MLPSMFDRLVRRIRPYGTSVDITRASETLPGFVWRASGVHQLYAGLIAVAVALLTFAPIDLQRRIVDDAIEHRDVRGLIWLGGIYALAILVQAGLKYTLFVYQGWVGESAVKESRDQLAVIAADRAGQGSAKGGQTVNVIGREIDTVGGFVGTSISDFVVNLTLMVSVATYMIYIQPTIALVSAIFLVPQIFLAFYMQRDLNVLVERQVGLVRKLGTEAIAESPDRSSNPAGQFRTIRAIFDNRMQFNFVKYGLKELLNIANAIGPLMVLLVGGYLVIQGQTTIGIVVAFVSGFERLSAPLRDLLDFYRDYEQARVQYQMITKWARGNVPAPEQG
jgi:ABC-type bacteriocin/lantibiotic exporter with double-glycine peptidase domain